MDPPQLNFLKFSELRHSLCVTRGTEERHGRRPSGNAFPKSANQKIKQKQNEFQMNEMNFCVSNRVANAQ